ncbi:MAG: sulfite exporter TauE/SafE family protein [Alphaproteobacteria bacterium]|nr:sulfite exporter TauE/SafE family protein [Alphaproteobacteria bacterium]
MSLPVELTVLALAGLVAGVINTLAGGGSFITLPVFIFMGLPAPVANATNRVGVLLQCATSALAYRQEGLTRAVDKRAVVACCAGAVVGALLSVDIDEGTLKAIIGVVMLAMLPVILLRPGRWLEGRPGGDGRAGPGGLLALFAVGVYGGFLQAGVGVLLLATLVLGSGLDLVRANVVKVVLVLLWTVPALAIYIAADLIAWPQALAMAAGSAAGGWLGARVTVRGGPQLVRAALIAVIVVSSGRLLGAW